MACMRLIKVAPGSLGLDDTVAWIHREDPVELDGELFGRIDVAINWMSSTECRCRRETDLHSLHLDGECCRSYFDSRVGCFFGDFECARIGSTSCEPMELGAPVIHVRGV